MTKAKGEGGEGLGQELIIPAMHHQLKLCCSGFSHRHKEAHFRLIFLLFY